jgi:hypothetical protein
VMVALSLGLKNRAMELEPAKQNHAPVQAQQA